MTAPRKPRVLHGQVRVSLAAPFVDGVLRAAERWWQSRRPGAWTEAQHFATPAVNQPSTAASVLARAVARWVARGKG